MSRYNCRLEDMEQFHSSCTACFRICLAVPSVERPFPRLAPSPSIGIRSFVSLFRRHFSILSFSTSILYDNVSLKSGLSISGKKFFIPRGVCVWSKGNKKSEIHINIRDCFSWDATLHWTHCFPWSGSVLRERPAFPEALCTFTKASYLNFGIIPLVSSPRISIRTCQVSRVHAIILSRIHTHMHFLTLSHLY